MEPGCRWLHENIVILLIRDGCRPARTAHECEHVTSQAASPCTCPGTQIPFPRVEASQGGQVLSLSLSFQVCWELSGAFSIFDTSYLKQCPQDPVLMVQWWDLMLPRESANQTLPPVSGLVHSGVVRLQGSCMCLQTRMCWPVALH